MRSLSSGQNYKLPSPHKTPLNHFNYLIPTHFETQNFCRFLENIIFVTFHISINTMKEVNMQSSETGKYFQD